MVKQDSAIRTFAVIGVLCFVCSVLVCLTVVVLKPLQDRQINSDREKSVLEAAGIDIGDGDISEIFHKSVNARLLNLDTGKFVDSADLREIAQCPADKSESDCAGSYNFVSESKLEARNREIEPASDYAGIKVRAAYMPVYFVRNGDGALTRVVLPFYGQGLWSTMYGYLAVGVDGSTIEGLKYYNQGETAGLGAEVTNPAYTVKWIAKKLYGDDGVYRFAVKKRADGNDPYQVDGISGATLTSDGVNASVRYWFEIVYADFLKKVKNREVQ